MKTTLFLSVSIDGLIADKEGIPLFPNGAWEDWCSLVNDADNVRLSYVWCNGMVRPAPPKGPMGAQSMR